MAFTEAEKNTISKILKVLPIDLTAWLVYNAVNITAQVETDVRAELDRWDASGAKFVRLTPTESNYGVNTDSSETKNDIRENIAILLGWSDLNVSSGNYLPRS